MDRIAFRALCLMILCLSACQRSPLDMPAAEDGLFSLTASAETQSGSRTVVGDDGAVLWEPGDSVKVFCGTASACFRNDLTAPAGTAVFTGPLQRPSAEDTLWALYPFREEATFDGTDITTVLPAVQTARESSFAPFQNLSVGRSDRSEMTFYNVGGGVRFTLKEAGVTKVTFEGASGEMLAGTLRIGFEEDRPVVRSVSDGSTTLTLLAPEGGSFQPGVWYFFVAVPGTLAQGFSLRFFKEGACAHLASANAVTIRRSIFGSVTEADGGSEYADPDDVFQKGVDCFSNEGEGSDFDGAFEYFSDAAQAGNDSAKFYLALCYEYELGAGQSLDKAIALYREAADAGNEEAAEKLRQLSSGGTNGQIEAPAEADLPLHGLALLCDNELISPNGDGSFSSDAQEVTLVTPDRNMVYMSYRHPDQAASPSSVCELNAAETAVSLMMWALPFAFDEMSLTAFEKMKTALAGLPETQALATAIDRSVLQKGYLEIDDITAEAEAAAAAVRTQLGFDALPDPSEAVPGTPPGGQPGAFSTRMRAPARPASTISPAEQPRIAGGYDYFRGVKTVLNEAVLDTDTHKWHCKFSVFNSLPIYLSLMPGIADETGYAYTTADDFLENICKPFNSNYIFELGGAEGIEKLWKGQRDFWSDTYKVVFKGMDSDEAYWVSTETKFEMDIADDHDVLMVFSTDHSIEVMAYSIYKLAFYPAIKQIISIDKDDEMADLLMEFAVEYLCDVDFLQSIKEAVRQREIRLLMDLVVDKATDLLWKAVDELGEDLFKAKILSGLKKTTNWADYATDKANREAFKATLTQTLKGTKTLLKWTKIACNLISWYLYQSTFPSFYVPFEVGEPSGIAVGNPLDLSPTGATIPVGISGDLFITGRGIVWSREETEPAIGGPGCTQVASDSREKQFNVTLEGLDPGTTYYVRGYMTLNAGNQQCVVVYSDPNSFTTTRPPVPTAVNLGLPSGTLWATFNLGASKPEEDGYLFAWGELLPKTVFEWDNYKWANGSQETLTKYNTKSEYGYVDNKTELDPEDDAARYWLGDGWRIPTYEDLEELSNTSYCTWTWKSVNGVPGYEVKIRKNGKSIFLPMTDWINGSQWITFKSMCGYWSTSILNGNPWAAYYLYITKDNVRFYGAARYGDWPIRPVK